jgi:hypothetical protein
MRKRIGDVDRVSGLLPKDACLQQQRSKFGVLTESK